MSRWFDEKGELTVSGRKLIWLLLVGYIFCLGILCFSPQPIGVEGVHTPNIFYIGRVPVLLVPFNSFLNIGQLDNFKKLFWIIGQNISNIFLLTPLMLGFLGFFKDWRRWRLVLKMSFLISLGIELMQVILDIVLDINRVFEVDDLITNTLGGLIALWGLPMLQFIVVTIGKTKESKD
ncbi:VanZ family protein [Streptococcus dentapri]|uniref:VanZ family protein n=1 Tax=Streptococcus dentapri TaxID=573564 RepID=A0ABV8D0R5_9STRE